jgi:cellulose synthase operon protein C
MKSIYLHSKICLSLVVLATSMTASALNTKEAKGLLPEVNLNSENEDKNQDTAYKSEMLITKSETKAIESLQKIIQKKKGTAEEADLLYRLAELYMRRAKSGRFFDLNADQKKAPVTQNAAESLNAAVKIYDSILTRFPKYANVDAVHFNIALASLQTKQVEKAKNHYTKITTDYQKSSLYPDALLELGELYYNQENFSTALEQFKKIEAFPKSKAYPYGVYKSAWCYYNLKDNEPAVAKLKQIVENNPADTSDVKKFNMRKEALRDLTLFVEESIPADQLYTFFRKITTDAELGEVIINLATLFESHSHYKEVTVFMKEFIEKNEVNPYVAKAYIKLIDVNEIMKQREAVLSYMQKLSDFCYEQDFSKDSTCKTEFKKISLDISKKWWDIWLKNKAHVEFSKLTEKSFEILLSKDDSVNPDSISRFAYAELLFQLGKYDKASENYELVSQDKKLDALKKHDALYGAIYSTDKLIEKDKASESVLADKQQRLTLRYVSEFPKGEYLEPLKFKLGFLAYQKQDSDEALKYLLPIATTAKDQKLKLKSEDIVLDIYNLKKDYKAIQAFAQKATVSNSADDRKKMLTQIKEEAHFSQMQLDMDKQDPSKKIEAFMAFSTEHKNSKLSKEALWQSISLAYANGFEIKGAELSLVYFEKFPQDPKALDSLKEAVKAYTDAGYIPESIRTLTLLSKVEPNKADIYAEMSCGLMQVNNQNKEAQQCYKSLFMKADKNRKLQLLAKLAETLGKNQNITDIDGMESIILRENIEPYATQSLISKSRRFLNDKKFSEAFNLSLKVNSRPVDSDTRAEARLIQAEILEKEFVSQSVKTTESKFSLVLSMKTEKLDKAYTAYTSTIKMSKNTKIHEQALRGIDRLYTHFIEAIANMPLPLSLSAADQTALKSELGKMTAPFVVKKLENVEKIKEISKNVDSVDAVIWSNLSVEKTVAPRLAFPVSTKLTAYLPNELKTASNEFSRLPAEASDKKCDAKKVSAASIGHCILSKKFSVAEGLALQLTATKENRAMGLYYMSVIADSNNHQYKSLWFVEKALALEPEISMFLYQKGKIVYTYDGIDAALPFFEKSLDLKRNSKEVSLISGLKSFSDKDFITASEELKKMSLEEQDKFNVSILLVESTAQKGNSAEAIKLGEKYLNTYAKNVDMYLELARIHEEFPENPANSNKLAIENYQKALSKSENVDQKDWLKRKISYLSEKS